MSSKKSMISVAVGSVFATTLVATLASATESPFTIQPMDKGYRVAESSSDYYGDKKAGEGKCGDMKAGEGTCGVKHSDGLCGAAMADINKDGKISKEEWTKHHDAMFEYLDVNKDGVLEKAELGKGKMAKKEV